MAIDIIARGMIESSKSDISQLFDITKGGEIVNNESSYTLNAAVEGSLLNKTILNLLPLSYLFTVYVVLGCNF